jgi:hypothetical protein
MTDQRKHLGSVALLAAALIVSAGAVQAAPKPPKPIALLGSHPTKSALTARTALLKERKTSVPFKTASTSKIANSLNHRPGKTITVARKLPK